MARTSDVQLVVRARNEAQRTLDQVRGAVDRLAGSQDHLSTSADRTGKELEQLERGLSQLQRYNSAIAASMESANTAMARQAQTLHATNSQIQERKARVAELSRALDLLKNEADKAFVGPPRNGLDAQIKQVQGQLKAANTDLGRLSTTFNQQLTALQSSRQAFGTIRAAQREAETSIAGVTAEIAQQTNAMEANTAAARRAKAAQSFFNAKAAPGLMRNPLAAGDKEEIASVLRVAEARDVEIQKLKAQEAATAELARTQEAQARAATLLPGNTATGSSAKASAAVFAEADAAAAKKFQDQIALTAVRTKELDAAAAKLRAELNPLAVIEEKLARETAELNALQKAGKISSKEQAAGLELLRKRAADARTAMNGASGLDSRGRPSLFGLKPYELQNLSFQINDIFTQLGSGTSLSQTLAQQGGQILQLFRGLGARIAAALSSAPVLAFVAGLGGVIFALKKTTDQAKELRILEGMLAGSADGADVQAKALQGAARELDRYGLSAKEALAQVRAFFRAGVDPTRFVEFGEAAKNLADNMGVELTQATKEVTEAFTAGYDAIKKLDDSYNFLTAAQRTHIRTLFEEGRAGDARNEALRIFSEQMERNAQKARGSWSEAFRALGAAWQTFTEKVTNSGPMQAASRWLDTMARGARALVIEMSGASNAAETLIQLQLRNNELLKLQKGIGSFGQRLTESDQRRFIAAKEKEIAALQAQLRQFQGQEGETFSDTLKEDSERQRKIDEDLRRSDERALAAQRELSNERRLQIAYEDALVEAQNKGASAAAARQHAENARAVKRREIEKEITAEREKQEREFARQLGENGRDQLVETAKRFAGFSENNTAQRGDLMQFFRQNGINVDPKMTAWCAAFVNAVLATNGLPGTGKLNARSFLGFGQDVTSNPQSGDIVVLKRGNNQAEGHVGFFQGFDKRGNVKVLGGNQGDQVSTRTFNREDVLSIRRAPSLGQVAADQVREEDKLLEKQQQYSDALDRQIETRKDDTRQLREQAGLTGEALIAAQRQAAIEDAVRKARQDAEKAGIAEDDPELQRRLDLIRETEGAYFDLARARDAAEARRTAVEQPVQDLTARRDEIQRQIEFFQQNGQGGLAAQLEPQLEAVNLRLDEAVEKALEFYRALRGNTAEMLRFGITSDSQLETIILRLQAASNSAIDLAKQFLQTGRQINESLAGQAASGFDQFAQRVAAGDNVFSSLRDTFLQFAADFLRQIAQMIVNQAVFNALGGANRSGQGSAGGFISGLIAGLFHDGGVVGRDGQARAASPQWYTDVQRFHTGGLPGLRSNEIPAILERGEEVLTRSDPRHVLNGGGAGGKAINLRNVNVFDASDVLDKALATRTGEQVLLNFVTRNKGAMKQAMG